MATAAAAVSIAIAYAVEDRSTTVASFKARAFLVGGSLIFGEEDCF